MIRLKENATISVMYNPVTKKYDSQKEMYITEITGTVHHNLIHGR
jgi:hypothetical protein